MESGERMMKRIRRLLQKPHDVPHYISTEDGYDLYAMGRKAIPVLVPDGTLPPLPDWWDDRDIKAFRFNVQRLKTRKSRLVEADKIIAEMEETAFALHELAIIIRVKRIVDGKTN